MFTQKNNKLAEQRGEDGGGRMGKKQDYSLNVNSIHKERT